MGAVFQSRSNIQEKGSSSSKNFGMSMHNELKRVNAQPQINNFTRASTALQSQSQAIQDDQKESIEIFDGVFS